MLHRKNTMVFHDLWIISQNLWLFLLFLTIFLSPLDLRHTKWTNFNHLCAQNLCTMSNCRVGSDWRFLAIFGFFWCWKCYQIDKNIFQTSYFSENHILKWKMLMYHSFNSNFLSRNGWIFVFWKLIGEVPWLNIFNFGKKWSHIGWRNSS